MTATRPVARRQVESHDGPGPRQVNQDQFRPPARRPRPTRGATRRQWSGGSGSRHERAVAPGMAVKRTGALGPTNSHCSKRRRDAKRDPFRAPLCRWRFPHCSSFGRWPCGTGSCREGEVAQHDRTTLRRKQETRNRIAYALEFDPPCCKARNRGVSGRRDYQLPIQHSERRERCGATRMTLLAEMRDPEPRADSAIPSRFRRKPAPLPTADHHPLQRS